MKKAYKENTISLKIHKELNDFLNIFAERKFTTKTQIIIDLIAEKFEQEKLKGFSFSLTGVP